MKKNRLLYSLALLLLLLGTVYSCQKESPDPNDQTETGIKSNDIELVKKAKTWHAENRTYVKDNGESDLKLASLIFEWDKYAIDTNKSGQQVLTVPIRSTVSTEAKYIELGFVLDQDGNGNGMIKEYMGNPFVGEMTLNLYTGIGKKFESGWYRADTKELTVKNISRYQNSINSKKMAGGGGMGGTLEEVNVYAPNPPYTPPPIIYIPPTVPTTPSPPSVPVYPGGTGGGGGGSGTTKVSYAITYDFKEYKCMQAFIENMENLTSFKNMIDPFRGANDGTGNPNLKWDYKTDLPWDPTSGYAYGVAATSDDSNRDVTISFNMNALNKSSDLIIAATAIHESIHAYSIYYLKTNQSIAAGNIDDKITDFWLTSALKTLEVQKLEGKNGDYRDHQTMMSKNVFPMMIGVLTAWGGNRYTSNEYVMASMLGLGKAGQMFGNQNVDEIKKIESLFKTLKEQFKISDTDFDNFLKKHSNVDPNSDLAKKKIPCAK